MNIENIFTTRLDIIFWVWNYVLINISWVQSNLHLDLDYTWLAKVVYLWAETLEMCFRWDADHWQSNIEVECSPLHLGNIVSKMPPYYYLLWVFSQISRLFPFSKFRVLIVTNCVLNVSWHVEAVEWFPPGMRILQMKAPSQYQL